MTEDVKEIRQKGDGGKDLGTDPMFGRRLEGLVVMERGM